MNKNELKKRANQLRRTILSMSPSKNSALELSTKVQELCKLLVRVSESESEDTLSYVSICISRLQHTLEKEIAIATDPTNNTLEIEKFFLAALEHIQIDFHGFNESEI